MGFIPKDACWYLADVVLEHVIEGSPRNVVHVNTHLIKAGSPNEAYQKALLLGRSNAQRYLNTDGKMVRVTFRGLRELNIIHEPLEDGAELTYEESVGVPRAELRKWLRPKTALAVFAPIAPATNASPNYMPESVMKQMEAAGFQRPDLGPSSSKAAAPDRGQRAVQAKRVAHRRRGRSG